jgi:hypothetical protein
MTLSLLQLCQAACSTAPVAQPTAIIGATDQTATLLLGLANDAGDELARRPPGGWVDMIREYDFMTQALLAQNATIANVGNSAVISGLSNIQAVTPNLWIASGTGIPNNAVVRSVTPLVTLTGPAPSTVTLSVQSSVTGAGSFAFGQAMYPLPSDFQRPIDNTFWDRSRFWSMRGPQSPQQWQLYKSSVIGRASIQRRYRFLSIFTPQGAGIGHLGAGTGLFGGNLASFQKYISIDPVPFDNGSQLVFEYVSNGWCMSPAGVPQDAWNTDEDVMITPLFEYLMRLSLKYRLLRRLGLSYNEELDEYERQVDKAMAHDGGSAILDLTPNNNLTLIGPWNLPETGFGNVLNS